MDTISDQFRERELTQRPMEADGCAPHHGLFYAMWACCRTRSPASASAATPHAAAANAVLPGQAPTDTDGRAHDGDFWFRWTRWDTRVSDVSQLTDVFERRWNEAC